MVSSSILTSLLINGSVFYFISIIIFSIHLTLNFFSLTSFFGREKFSRRENEKVGTNRKNSWKFTPATVRFKIAMTKRFLSSSHVKECVNEGHEFLLRAQLLLEEVRAVCGAP